MTTALANEDERAKWWDAYARVMLTRGPLVDASGALVTAEGVADNAIARYRKRLPGGAESRAAEVWGLLEEATGCGSSKPCPEWSEVMQTLRVHLLRLPSGAAPTEAELGKALDERDLAERVLDDVLCLLGWEGEWSSAVLLAHAPSIASELLAAKWIERVEGGAAPTEPAVYSVRQAIGETDLPPDMSSADAIRELWRRLEAGGGAAPQEPSDEFNKMRERGDAWRAHALKLQGEASRPQGGAEPGLDLLCELDRAGFRAAAEHLEHWRDSTSEEAAPPPPPGKTPIPWDPACWTGEDPEPNDIDQLVMSVKVSGVEVSGRVQGPLVEVTREEPSGPPDAPGWVGGVVGAKAGTDEVVVEIATEDEGFVFVTVMTPEDDEWGNGTEDPEARVAIVALDDLRHVLGCTSGDAGLRGRVEALREKVYAESREAAADGYVAVGKALGDVSRMLRAELKAEL